jgi:hypothetical protein
MYVAHECEEISAALETIPCFAKYVLKEGLIKNQEDRFSDSRLFKSGLVSQIY